MAKKVLPLMGCGCGQFSPQLTEAEEVALRTGDVGPDFYAALERSRTVHADCRHLLTTAAQQTTALGVMEHMSTLQEAALERLYRWTSSQCRHVCRTVADYVTRYCVPCLPSRGRSSFSFLVLTKGVTSHIEVVRALDLMSMTQHAVSPQIVADRMPISGE